MTDRLTISPDDLKRFAPKAKQEYVTALLGNLYLLQTNGILDNSYRLCHFMAQIAHETGGFTILREDLSYRSTARLRQVWPARFRSKTDGELKPLLRDPRKLGDAVYAGRMGNTQPGDGYDYRGGGFLQTTGKGAVKRYCERLGLDPSPSLLDDHSVTLQFACIEWVDAKCNQYADENDLTKVSKAINTGSATGSVKPVGMASRQKWFAKAWGIWGEKGKPDTPPAEPMTTGQIVAKVGTPVAAVSTGAARLIQSPPDLSQVAAWKSAATQAQEIAQWALSNWTISAAAGAVYIIMCHVIPAIPKVKERLS